MAFRCLPFRGYLKTVMENNNNFKKTNLYSTFKDRITSVVDAPKKKETEEEKKKPVMNNNKKDRSKEKRGVLQFRDLNQFIETKKTMEYANARRTLITNGYLPVKFLGSGKFGKVYLCKNVLDDSYKAVKFINIERDKKEFRWTWITNDERKAEKVHLNTVQQCVEKLPSGFVKDFYLKAKEELLQKLDNLENPLYKNTAPARFIAEKEILKILGDFPFFTTLLSSFRDTQFVFLVFANFEGGNLLNLLQNKKKLSEKEACFYVGELFLAIEFLSKHEIFHRDVKPGNVLIDREGHIALSDFGLATRLKEGLRTLCGTVDYIPPEVLSSKTWSAQYLGIFRKKKKELCVF